MQVYFQMLWSTLATYSVDKCKPFSCGKPNEFPIILGKVQHDISRALAADFTSCLTAPKFFIRLKIARYCLSTSLKAESFKTSLTASSILWFAQWNLIIQGLPSLINLFSKPLRPKFTLAPSLVVATNFLRKFSVWLLLPYSVKIESIAFLIASTPAPPKSDILCRAVKRCVDKPEWIRKKVTLINAETFMSKNKFGWLTQSMKYTKVEI